MPLCPAFESSLALGALQAFGGFCNQPNCERVTTPAACGIGLAQVWKPTLKPRARMGAEAAPSEKVTTSGDQGQREWHAGCLCSTAGSEEPCKQALVSCSWHAASSVLGQMAHEEVVKGKQKQNEPPTKSKGTKPPRREPWLSPGELMLHI